MAFEKGSTVVVGIGRETTYGTASTGPFLQVPIISLDGGLTQDLMNSELLQANRNRTEPFLDEKKVAFTMVIQADVRMTGFIFCEIFGLPTTTLDSPSAGHNTHVWKVLATLPIGFTLENYFGVNGLPLQLIGCKINGFSFELTSGGVLKLTLQCVGKDGANATRIDSAPYLYPITRLELPACDLFEAAVQTEKATKYGVTFTNNLEEIRTVASGGTVNNHMEGWGDVSFNLTMPLESWAMYQKATLGTKTALRSRFPSTSHAVHYLDIALNEARLKVKSPGIPGPGLVSTDLDGIAFFGTDAAASSIVVTAVNDVAAYTSIPA